MAVTNKTSHALPVIDPTIIGLDGKTICHSDGQLPTDGRHHERMLRVMGCGCQPTRDVKCEETENDRIARRLAGTFKWTAIILMGMLGLVALMVGGWIFKDLIGSIPRSDKE